MEVHERMEDDQRGAGVVLQPRMHPLWGST
jgi:hypothetical protein